MNMGALGSASDPRAGADARMLALATSSAKAKTEVEGLTNALEKDKKVQREKGAVNKDLAASFTNLGLSLQLSSHYLVALGTGLGANQLYEFLKEVTVLAGRVDTLGIVLNNVGTISGYTRGTLSNLEQQIKSLGITTQAARQSMVLLAQGEIDLSNAAKLSRIAQDAAVIAGINSSEAFERLVVAIQRTNTWMLRNLGIMINLHNVYREYAVTSGRVSTTLSTNEKQQLLLNEVLKKGVLIQGSYESAMASVHKQYTSLDRVIEETKRSLGLEMQPIFEKVVSTSNFLLNSFQALDDSTKAWVASVLIGVSALFALSTALAAVSAAIILVRLAAGDLTASLGLAVITLAALGVGASAYGIMIRGHLVRDLKEAAREGSALAAANHALATSYAALMDAEQQRLARGELTIDQLKTIDNEVLNIAAHLPELANQFRAMDTSKPGEIAQALIKARVMAAQSVEFQAEMYESKLAHIKGAMDQLKPDLEAARELVEKRKTEARETSSTGSRRNDWQQLNIMWQKLDNALGEAFTGKAVSPESKLRDLEAQHNALLVEEEKFLAAKRELNLLSDSEIARNYENMVKQQETAHNLALRVLNQFNNDRTNIFKDSNVKIFEEYKHTIENLSRQFMSEEQIKKGIASSLEVRLQEFAAKRDEMVQVARDRNVGGSLSDEELEKVKRNANSIFDAQKAELGRASAADQVHQLKVREEIIKTFEVARERFDLERKMKELTRTQEMEYQREIAAGETERIARLNRELTLLKLMTEETVKQRNLVASELGKQEGELVGKIGKLVGPNSAKERERLEAELKTVRETIKANEQIILDVEKDAATKSAELEQERMSERKKIREKFVEDVKKLEEQLHDSEIKLHNHIVDMEEKRDAERLRRAKEVLNAEKDILSQQEKSLKELSSKFKTQFDERVKAIEMQREFGKLLGQGATPGQAMAAVSSKFGVKPVGVQQFERAVKFEQDRIDAAQKVNAQQILNLEKAADLAHKKKVEEGFVKADQQRVEITKELVKIREALTKEKGEGEAAAARAGEFPLTPMPPLITPRSGTLAARWEALKSKLASEERSDERIFFAGRTTSDSLGPDESVFFEKTNKRQEELARRRKVRARRQSLLQGLNEGGGMDSTLTIPGAGGRGAAQQLLQDAMKEKNDAFLKMQEEEMKAREKVARGELATAAQAKETRERIAKESSDFERAFAARNLA